MPRIEDKPAIAKKRQQEVATLKTMIVIYCHGQKHNPPTRKMRDYVLCDDCQDLADQAMARTANCPHMATKTFCSACDTPCYPPQLRNRIRAVMRYSGMRMLIHSPLKALRHVFVTISQIAKHKQKH